VSAKDSPTQPAGGVQLAEWHLLAGVGAMLSTKAVPAAELAGIRSGTDAAVAFLRKLIADGMLPAPQRYLAGLLHRVDPVLRRGCDPLRAELTGCEFLGDLTSTVPAGRAVGEAMRRLLKDLVAGVEACRTREALAVLRILAVVAEPAVRPAARAAADRLAADGLEEPTWAGDVGAPAVGECCGYVDAAGGQETVVAAFAYPGRKPHGLAVLIDHNLGGGVKDCWVSRDPQRTRRDYRQVADRHGLDFFDYPPGHTRSVLERALEHRPCPVAADQVDDVRDCLPLLRQRAALLPTGDAAPVLLAPVRSTASKRSRSARPAGSVGGQAVGSGVHRLKVTLRGSKPPIWRRLEVPSEITLERLHRVVQVGFGWYGGHLWVFETPAGEYGQPDAELGHADAAAVTLDDVALGVGDQIRYVYDFGDDWRHDILVEEVAAAQPGVAYPRCTAGRRARPPEDCGGMWAYQDLLEILADPGHPEHAEALNALGVASAEAFDPARFDRDVVNAQLSNQAAGPTLRFQL
jgi:hypothetical protein